MHRRLKRTPGFKWLDALLIAVYSKLIIPSWLSLRMFGLWIRLGTVALGAKGRILVVARYGGIGDIICTFPAVAELVRQNLGNTVVYVVSKSYRALIERSGLDVKVVAVREAQDLPSKPRRMFKQSTLLFHPGEHVPTKEHPCRLTDGFARRLGFAAATGKPTLRVDRQAKDALRAEFLGRHNQTKHGTPVPPASASAALGQRLVLLHGGPTWTVKEWSLESWVRLVERLKSELGCVILQLSAARNVMVKDPVSHVIPGAVPVDCEDDIDKLIDLVAAVDVLVGIDSGPIHVAGAVGTPCVALFGPTDPEVILFDAGTARVFHRVHCSFCHHRHPRLHWISGCPHDIQCMKALTVEEVFVAVAIQLSRAVPKP